MNRMLALALLVTTGAQQERPAQAPQDQQDPQVIVLRVSQRKGDDGAGDGTVDRPFATIRRALELHAKAWERPLELRLDVGHFGADRGEAFPMRLPASARIAGYGSRSCEIVGGGDKPLFELPAGGKVAIEGVGLRGATTAIVATAGDANRQLDVTLVDVLVEQSDLALDLTPARSRLALRADGLRVVKAETGLLASAGARLSLTLDRCEFTECGDGVVITCDDAPDDGPWQELTVRSCRFDRSRTCGLARRGKDARNGTQEPWRIESSEFRGCAIGLSFEMPGGDVWFELRDCDFVANDNFGLVIVGSGTELPGASRIEGCRFRWNGVGGQLLTMGRALDLVDSRFEDSMGIGLNFGNWVGERSVLRAQRCLFVRNGAAGFFGLCERARGLDVELDRCTIADNRGSGVEKKNRKRGSGSWKLARCIVSGNAPDLQAIDEDETEQCLVGGDPRFVDRVGHDWRPAADSPARTAGGVIGALD